MVRVAFIASWLLQLLLNLRQINLGSHLEHTALPRLNNTRVPFCGLTQITSLENFIVAHDWGAFSVSIGDGTKVFALILLFNIEHLRLTFVILRFLRSYQGAYIDVVVFGSIYDVSLHPLIERHHIVFGRTLRCRRLIFSGVPHGVDRYRYWGCLVGAEVIARPFFNSVMLLQFDQSWQWCSGHL